MQALPGPSPCLGHRLAQCTLPHMCDACLFPLGRTLHAPPFVAAPCMPLPSWPHPACPSPHGRTLHAPPFMAALCMPLPSWPHPARVVGLSITRGVACAVTPCRPVLLRPAAGLFAALSQAAHRQLPQLGSQAVINVLWSLIIMQHFDEDLLSAAFKRLEQFSTEEIGFQGEEDGGNGGLAARVQADGRGAGLHHDGDADVGVSQGANMIKLQPCWPVTL